MRSPTHARSFTLLADQRQLSVTAFVGLLVLAGSLSSLIAALLFCRLPPSHPSHTPSFAALFVRALIYVAIGTGAGVLGAWYYWRQFSSPFKPNVPLSFALLALTNAAGWVWVPSVVLLIRQDSPATAAVAVIVAAIAATGLRKNLSAATVPLDRNSSAPESEETELFAESLRTPPRKAPPYVIAVCIYAAAFALFGRENLTASAPLALGTFLFAWEFTLAPGDTPDSTKKNTRAALRLTCVALPAVLVTLFALLDGVPHRDHSGTIAFARGSPSGNGSHKKRQSHGAASEISSYESVILWPFREKKQIVPPLPVQASLLDPGTTKPLVIRFDGSYWYFQVPNKRPDPKAHQAHGSPLNRSIRSDNSIPLTMEAHQSLGIPIDLARCREIQVDIENRDNRPGTIALAVLLTDSASPGKPTLYLGQQPVVTSEQGPFAFNSSPAHEVLSFPVPEHAKIRKFDGITVMFLADVEDMQVGPKIAIQQFNLLPR